MGRDGGFYALCRSNTQRADPCPNSRLTASAKKNLIEGKVEMRKNVLGEEHPDTLTSMNNLAVTWKHQGHTGDALALMRNCVVLRERVLDIDHPDAASSAVTLANWEEGSDLP
ncbi:hypothetical protein AUP68_06285 [Ilyonectria robusta]